MTFLRWAGSKKQILETLSQAWYASGSTGRYIEAFSGSAALFFHLQPRKAILIDCNSALQECMNTVKNRPLSVATILSKYSGTESEYYTTRAANTTALTREERAARFIYLNRYCFNGLYRTNSKGWFNVPFGGKRNGGLPDHLTLVNYAKLLKKAKIVCGDFYDETLKNLQPKDFVYLDPPYARRNHNLDFQYGPDEFGVEDLKRLYLLAQTIHERGAYFVISYAKCREMKPFLNNWSGFTVEVKRTIAASVENRRKTAELLISNI